jgi:hypothetical protein
MKCEECKLDPICGFHDVEWDEDNPCPFFKKAE